MFEIDGAWQIRGGNLQSLLLLRQVFRNARRARNHKQRGNRQYAALPDPF